MKDAFFPENSYKLGNCPLFSGKLDYFLANTVGNPIL